MKYFVLICLFLSAVSCYDNVYNMDDGNAIMTMNYCLTGILVPWIIALVLCIVSCVCCCVPKKHRANPTFVAVSQQPVMVIAGGMQYGQPQQPMYGQTQQPMYGQTQQPTYGQQVMSPMTNVGQPLTGGDFKN